MFKGNSEFLVFILFYDNTDESSVMTKSILNAQALAFILDKDNTNA